MSYFVLLHTILAINRANNNSCSVYANINSNQSHAFEVSVQLMQEEQMPIILISDQFYAVDGLIQTLSEQALFM